MNKPPLSLYDEIEAYKKYSPENVPKIPTYITDNIKHELFDWQIKALENFIIHIERQGKETTPTTATHLMFNMATGTGKTLLMASCILYYYNQGYRKFIFIATQNNILDKTESNFINETHSKHLFVNTIIIDNKPVKIKKVNTFSNNADAIEIKFSTIHKLHNDIHSEEENQVYLDDLIKKDIVLLADEGHHLNANTKKWQGELNLKTKLKEMPSPGEVERKGWEHTVIELLLNKNGNADKNKNVLLEFTATIPDNDAVEAKYAQKTICKFELKDFLLAGYTKEINLLSSSSLSKKERMLLSVLFNWYREQIAVKHGIANFKGVILFRSRSIKDSKADYEEFLTIIKNLKLKDLKFLDDMKKRFCNNKDSHKNGSSRVLDLIKFIEKKAKEKDNIVEVLKYNFTKRQCIITNSEDNINKEKEKTTPKQDKLLNSLENVDNNIRAIFTVNRLTEGWDVLNLFDIVRLYEGGAEKKSTISEIQLIGRGVRYYPFAYPGTIKNKRKFDETKGKHDLKILEELYYYSDSDPTYIQALKDELEEKGYYIAGDGKLEISFKLKEDFIKSNIYKNVNVIGNERIENRNYQNKAVKDIKGDLDLQFNLNEFGIKEERLGGKAGDGHGKLLSTSTQNKTTIHKEVKDFERHILYKAININAQSNNSLLRFDILNEEFKVKSIDEFIEGIIGELEIKIVTTKSSFDKISNQEKLGVLIDFLNRFSSKYRENVRPYKGSDFGVKSSIDKVFGKEVKRRVDKKVYEDADNTVMAKHLKNEGWYVLDQFYGTSEERNFIEFLEKTIGNLKRKYKEVYLLRNEEQYKIYDFDTGQGFQPDFILFLKGKRSKLYYQVLIEPKGDHLLLIDEWKNKFLKKITKKYSGNNILKIGGTEYNLIGLPLFNQKNHTQEFSKAYDRLF